MNASINASINTSISAFCHNKHISNTVDENSDDHSGTKVTLFFLKLKKLGHLMTCLGFLLLLTSSVRMAFANNDTILKSNAAGENMLSVEDIKSDVGLLKKAYKRIHPGYTRYTSEEKMTKAWDDITQQAANQNGMQTKRFYIAIQSVLSLIRCDHTKANLPKVMKQYRDINPVYLPFRWTWIDGRAFVTVSDNQGLLNIHDEILSIDGEPIQTMVEKVLPLIPYDGYTAWSRNSGIAESLEFKGGAFDHFGSLMWETKPEVIINIKTKQGDITAHTMQRLNYKEYTALAGKNPSFENFKDAITFERIGERVAYLKVDTFVNYRNPVDPADMYDPIFKTIQQENRNVLILDLRNNGGGSSDASQGLLANLIAKKMKYKLDMYVNTLEFQDIRPHLWTWDDRALDPSWIGFSKNDNNTYSLRSWFTDELDVVKPAKYAFNGKIIALTSNNNSSGSTNLLSVIHSTGRVKLIGEKTGGSAEGATAGVLFTLTLPKSKITTRIPFFRFKNNVKSFTQGMGLLPDVEAAMTAEALLNGQDPALFEALKYANDN